jgi:flavin-dependent dehydrogenase
VKASDIPFDFDVTIIGGGPAGASAAAFARQAGFRTLVIEKEAFPRFRIGESLLPHGNRILRESGAWPKIERAGFIEKRGAFFYAADGSAGREVIFADGIVPGLDTTFQVERARFDALLLDNARELGAEVRLPATVTAVEESADAVVVTYRTQDGERRVRSRWLLDGSGRDRQVRTPLKAELDPPRLARRVAIYTHLRGVARGSGIQAGHTVIVRLADGWFWLIPIDAERTSVGLVTTAETMRSARLEPKELFWREVAASPKLRELLDGAEAVMGFHVTADYSYFHRRLAHGRTVLLGDAAGFFDPIFSSGVYLATYSAQRAVAMIHAADTAGRGLSRFACWRYTRAIKRHANVFQRLISAFYDNASFSVFMCPRPPLDLARGVNAIVAGHARLIWPIRWRFWAFLLVCRLQRHLQLVPVLPMFSIAPSHRPTFAGTSDAH